jgi:RimJ/RimL family protein N-acetyltransferase
VEVLAMDKDMIIETDRLILRQWNMNDIADMVEGLNNINVTKWLAGAPYPYTEKDAEDFVKKTIDNNLYNFAIVLKSENKVIGGTQLTNISLANGTAGGGIWINENYQGYGYGTEAFGARIKYAFEVLGLRRLENGYFKENEKSHKMQLRFGYKDEGIRRKRFVSKATGKIEDEYITGLLKEEWID